MAQTIFTLGHSTRSLDSFLALLREHGVTQVIDVRRFPVSHRHPYFSGEELAATLREAGLGYRHEPDLGGRRKASSESRNGGWRAGSFRAYADYMETTEFRGALDAVIGDASTEVPVLLCAEAVPWRCHRQLISDALVARGLAVRHVMGSGTAPQHSLTRFAQVQEDMTVIYPSD
ncbi:MAG: DUF488 domain-containing protein [Gemmatimonadota bacterium]